MSKIIAYLATDRNGKCYLHSNPPVQSLEGYLSGGVIKPIEQETVSFELPKFEDGPVKVEFVLKKVTNEEEKERT